MRSNFVSIALISVGALAANVQASDPLAWLPAGVNAVARLNVAEIYQSPLAKKEGWLKKSMESFIQQESFIPPGTNQIVIGAELDLSENLVAYRKYSIVVPDSQLTLEKLSAWLPGGISTLSGKPVAQFGNDGYVVDAGDGCWLTMASSSRQLLSRWLRNGPTPGAPQLSSYLRSALTSKENTAQFVMAIDLQDNFAAEEIAAELKSSHWVETKTGVEQISKVLESIRGITIRIAVDTERTGTATLDFANDTSPLKPIIEKLVAAVLHRVGASSEDVQNWNWKLQGKQITGTGPVSPGGAREILSLLEPPSITHAISASTATSANTETPEDRMAKTSLNYCQSIQVLLNDLRSTLRKEKDNHALHFERYGRKIDNLPMLNVDSVLLNFGSSVSSSLRYQAQVQRMSKIRTGTRTQQTFAAQATFGNVGRFDFGGNQNLVGDGTAAAGAAIAIGAAENQAAKEVRFSEWQQIEDGLVAVRRAMTEKYKREF